MITSSERVFILESAHNALGWLLETEHCKYKRATHNLGLVFNVRRHLSKIIKERIKLQLASNKRCKLVRETKLSCSFSHLCVHWQIPLKHEHYLFLFPGSRSFLLLCEAYLYVPESSFFMSAQINKAELFPENLWQNSCRPLIFIHAHFTGTGETTFYVCLGISQHFLSFPCTVQLCFSLESFYLTKSDFPQNRASVSLSINILNLLNVRLHIIYVLIGIWTHNYKL